MFSLDCIISFFCLNFFIELFSLCAKFVSSLVLVLVQHSIYACIAVVTGGLLCSLFFAVLLWKKNVVNRETARSIESISAARSCSFYLCAASDYRIRPN